MAKTTEAKTKKSTKGGNWKRKTRAEVAAIYGCPESKAEAEISRRAKVTPAVAARYFRANGQLDDALFRKIQMSFVRAKWEMGPKNKNGEGSVKIRPAPENGIGLVQMTLPPQFSAEYRENLIGFGLGAPALLEILPPAPLLALLRAALVADVSLGEMIGIVEHQEEMAAVRRGMGGMPMSSNGAMSEAPSMPTGEALPQ